MVLALTGMAVPALAVECAGTGTTELVENIDFCVDSVLASQSGNRYGPANLFDGDRGTAWCEGVSGDGVGQTITLYITNGVPFDKLMLWNGYQKNETTFARNARPRKIAVKSQIEPKRTFELPDTSKQINLQLKTMAERIKVVVEILEVYPGTHYQDMCISGLFADLESGRDYQPEPTPPAVLPPAAPSISSGNSPQTQSPAPDLREIAPLPDLPGL